jgi:hypothetical protein
MTAMAGGLTSLSVGGDPALTYVLTTTPGESSSDVFKRVLVVLDGRTCSRWESR